MKKRFVLIVIPAILVSGCVRPVPNVEPSPRDKLVAAMNVYAITMRGFATAYQNDILSEEVKEYVNVSYALGIIPLTAWYEQEKLSGNGELELAYKQMVAANRAWINVIKE